MKGALNPGTFNKIIVELTRSTLFTEVFDIPPYTETDPNDYYENPQRQRNTLYSSMGDCQLVLRYFALKENENIRGSMKSMLDRAMEKEVTEQQAQALKQEYIERFSFLYNLFDRKPFRLPPDDKGHERVSAAIYDAAMVAMNDLWGERGKIQADAANVKQRMANATVDPAEIIVLTGQGNTANAVKDRIKLVRNILLPE